MAKSINMAHQMEKQLPAELVNFMQAAGELAHSNRQSLYLVGGVVRDLLLGQGNFDLDLVVEGNAIELATRLAQIKLAKIKTHPRFNTAKLQWDSWSVDLAAARSETYARPGALPMVKPGSLNDDLFRRDFTINTMAICLNPDRYGELIDIYGGLADLENKLIRILHEKSFIDDATRIWRALRYEQRLDFQIEARTLELLKRDIPYLDTVSGNRIRHELELVFREKRPERVLRRAGELGVLAKLHPALKGNNWLGEKFEQARQISAPNLPAFGLYFALLAYPLTKEESEQLISYLKLPKLPARVLQDTIAIKEALGSLAESGLAPSTIYSVLRVYSAQAIIANLIATNNPVIHQRLQLFLEKLRYVKTALTGDDVKRMGITNGPLIGEILHFLHQARLDGKVSSKKEEERLAKSWLANQVNLGE